MGEGGEDMENGVQGKQTKFVLTVEPVAFLYVTAALVQVSPAAESQCFLVSNTLLVSGSCNSELVP